MTLRILAAVSLFVLVGLAGFMLTRFGTTATGFNPSSSISLSDPLPGAQSDINGTYSIPAPDPNFQNAGGIIYFTPGAWGIGSCPTDDPMAANQACADFYMPDGAIAGALHANATLGLFNGGCNTELSLDFELMDAETDMSSTVIYGDDPIDVDTQGEQFEIGPDDVPLGVSEYPDYLMRLLRTEPYPAGVPLQPIQRLYSQLLIAGTDISVQFLVFPPGTTVNGKLMDPRLGFPAVTVLEDTGDPLRERRGSNITNFCTPLDVDLTAFGATHDNPDTALEEGGFFHRTNPTQGGYNFTVYSRSQPDADNDGIENRLDPCPISGNASGWDPRLANGPSNADQDSDGIPDDCDTAVTPFDGNADGDADAKGVAFQNKQDNCPQVANPLQTDSDDDGLGDACDPTPNTISGIQLESCGVVKLDLGAGGTPNSDPLTAEPCASISTPTPTPTGGFGRGFDFQPLPFFFNPFRFPPPPVINPDPVVSRIEFTQSIQCLDQSIGDTNCTDNLIPLVSRRITWVRVFVRGGPSDILNVPVRLTIERNNVAWLTLDSTTTARNAPFREDLTSSANFVFLCDLCNNEDVLNFRARIDVDNVIAEPDEDNNFYPTSGTLDLTVYDRRGFHILALPMHYDPPGDVDATTPKSALTGQAAWLTSAFPVMNLSPYVDYEIGPVYDYTSDFDYAKLTSAINTAYVVGGATSPPDQITIMVPPETGFGNGVSDPLWGGGRGVVTIIDTGYAGPNARGRVLAHEVAHNFGRRHPCSSNAKDDPSWPYTGTGVAGLDYTIHETGIRTTIDVAWLWFFPLPIFSPAVRRSIQLDMMQGGHCGFPGASAEPNSNDVRWVSPYTYQQLFCVMSTNAATSSSCRNGNAVALGSTSDTADVARPAGAAGPAILVNGTLDPSGSGDITSVYRMDQGSPSPDLAGTYCVALQTGGADNATACFEPDFENFDSEATGPQNFSIVLPWTDGSDEIALRRAGQVLDSVQVSANAPTVQVTQPDTGGHKAGNQTVEWTAADADGDPLLFTVIYSPDGGATFTPIAGNITDTDLTANLDELPGGDDAFFRVVATDNTGNTTSADSTHFQVDNKPPVPQILSPDDGSDHMIGNPVVLTGTASDKEDGALPDGVFVWKSDIDGDIANAPADLVASLTPGLHTITLEVTDSKGLKGFDSIHIFVGIPTYADFQPDAVSVGSPPGQVLVHVELPFGNDINNVDQATLRLLVGNTPLEASRDVTIGDFDNDGLADLQMPLDPAAVAAALPNSGTEAVVTLSGELMDGTPFRGHDLVGLGLKGDADCDGDVDSLDALHALRSVAGLPVTAACLQFTNIDCDTDIDSIDALLILSHVAGLPVNLPEGCSDITIAALGTGAGADGRGFIAALGLGRYAWPGLAFIVPALVLARRRRRW